MCDETCKSCNKTTGLCENGCYPGWKGLYCEQGKKTPSNLLKFMKYDNKNFSLKCIKNTQNSLKQLMYIISKDENKMSTSFHVRSISNFKTTRYTYVSALHGTRFLHAIKCKFPNSEFNRISQKNRYQYFSNLICIPLIKLLVKSRKLGSHMKPYVWSFLL